MFSLQDIPLPPDVAGQLNLLVMAILGFLGVGAANLGKRFATAIMGADSKITAVYKKVQPMIALAVGVLLPILGRLIPGVELPNAEVLVSAPIGTVVFIALRELKEYFYPGKTA